MKTPREQRRLAARPRLDQVAFELFCLSGCIVVATVAAFATLATAAAPNPVEPHASPSKSPSNATATDAPNEPDEEASILARQTRFWLQIYTELTEHQALIHDASYPELVYGQVEFHPSGGVSRARWALQEKLKIKATLLAIHHKQQGLASTLPTPLSPLALPLTPEEARIVRLFRQSGIAALQQPHAFLAAAHRKRLHLQIGQKEAFQSGFKASRPYLKAMENQFRQAKIPPSFTRLPFVESSFNPKARSKVGASGLWQLMPLTAQAFFPASDSNDPSNDPRNDTYLATQAAAQLLQLNQQFLGNWPLAITAYNHGRSHLLRGTRRVGSHALATLIVQDRKRAFGFASRNFWAQLQACIAIEQHPERFFPPAHR